MCSDLSGRPGLNLLVWTGSGFKPQRTELDQTGSAVFTLCQMLLIDDTPVLSGPASSIYTNTGLCVCVCVCVLNLDVK